MPRGLPGWEAEASRPGETLPKRLVWLCISACLVDADHRRGLSGLYNLHVLTSFFIA